MTPIVLKSLVAVAVLATSAPILAAPSRSTEKTLLRYDAKTDKYCLTVPAETGSRIGKTICKTAVQWSDAGLDMPKSVVLAQR